MRHIFVLVLLLSFNSSFAQYTISGTVTDTAADVTWAILYHLESGKETFIENTKVKDKHFEFELPVAATSGMYRVTYRLKGPGHVDFLFDKEAVSFRFDSSYPEESVVFDASKQNMIFLEYLTQTSRHQTYIDSIQVTHFRSPKEEHSSLYKMGMDRLVNVQKEYENKTKHQLVHPFIKATNRFNASELQANPSDYYTGIKNNFFTHINFKDSVLVGSNFLFDRVDDYVFYLHRSNKQTKQQELYKEAVTKVFSEKMSVELQKQLLYYLVETFVKRDNFELVNYLLDTLYASLPEEVKDAAYITTTKAKITLAIGAYAPDFEWEENEETYSLSSLDTHKYYVVVFWSSGCSHCKKQLPKMYQFMKTHPKAQVVAVALERNSKEWKKVKGNFEGWHHILGLKKWRNTLAETYDVSNTPTYFVLDAAKKIIAKPENFRALEKTVNNLR